jgi:hypothetical protein
MSWTEYLKVATVEDVAAAEPNEFTAQSEWHVEQFEAARDVAVVLLSSGVVGDPDKFNFNISLNGHGNVNHEPDPAWTNDCVTINVYQAGAIDAGTEE